ncbi:uncharacterized protein BT62DRAFT_999853 [Guyanagaster necrorhizus]|uniref:Uncharacterized protein n=1 Tax=Guyanagaster necrorhizus TaxID=856835 RepID=A0A9P8AY52_9AGAR|nr:uncharacterized protein BT62DRAFT_999853 [Guyanagaster necrorhizus MCA 3950]KAG7452090.1 hypothetical protein BT62DRAFT_999853 [Guyanagaster necrorhizus MCA 3950]
MASSKVKCCKKKAARCGRWKGAEFSRGPETDGADAGLRHASSWLLQARFFVFIRDRWSILSWEVADILETIANHVDQKLMQDGSGIPELNKSGCYRSCGPACTKSFSLELMHEVTIRLAFDFVASPAIETKENIELRVESVGLGLQEFILSSVGGSEGN